MACGMDGIVLREDGKSTVIGSNWGIHEEQQIIKSMEIEISKLLERTQILENSGFGEKRSLILLLFRGLKFRTPASLISRQRRSCGRKGCFAALSLRRRSRIPCFVCSYVLIMVVIFDVI
jgi:hypothetical protein